MASEPEKIHRQLISIKDLPTRSVTIYPSRAAVVRDIENIDIKTGCNEITIAGLSMHLDQHSLKVEGRGLGTALISDTVVSMVRAEDNIFDCESDDEDPVPEESLWSDELKEAAEHVKTLEKEYNVITRKIVATDNLSKSLEKNAGAIVLKHGDASQLSQAVEVLRNESERLSALTEKYQGGISQLYPGLREAKNRRDKLIRKFKRSAEGREWARQRDERLKAMADPSFGYKVEITIEKDSLQARTPSIAAEISTGKPPRPDDHEAPKGATSYLRISYIIGAGVSWNPRYDLCLDTMSATGHLVCRAGIYATTGETWRDTKVTLSNSQSTFGGLSDKAPPLSTWAVSLQKKEEGSKPSGGDSSREENMPHPSLRGAPAPNALQDYQMQLMLLEQQNKKRLVMARQEQQQQSHSFSPTVAGPCSYTAFGRSAPSVQPLSSPPLPVYASSSQPPLPTPSFEASASLPSFRHTSAPSTWDYGGYDSALPDNFDFDSFLNMDDSNGGPALLGREKQPHQQQQQQQLQKLREASSVAITHGITATYELPGTRTFVSSPQLRRHAIAEMKLAAVEINFRAVPKLRSAVYMSAKIQNSSSVALLKGLAGLTLDGSFMGTTDIPRCFPGDSFEVGLGVAESIQVTYAKPVKKAASQGMLVKEQVVTYSRQVQVHSSRPGLSMIRILDQVPVSEDERLRLAILTPRGLRNAGDHAKVVVPKGDVNIIARLKKGGGVMWDVELPEGRQVTLDLEYEVRFPKGDDIVGV